VHVDMSPGAQGEGPLSAASFEAASAVTVPTPLAVWLSDLLGLLGAAR
jgi:hypothetical protein